MSGGSVSLWPAFQGCFPVLWDKPPIPCHAVNEMIKPLILILLFLSGCGHNPQPQGISQYGYSRLDTEEIEQIEPAEVWDAQMIREGVTEEDIIRAIAFVEEYNPKALSALSKKDKIKFTAIGNANRRRDNQTLEICQTKRGECETNCMAGDFNLGWINGPYLEGCQTGCGFGVAGCISSGGKEFVARFH